MGGSVPQRVSRVQWVLLWRVPGLAGRAFGEALVPLSLSPGPASPLARSVNPECFPQE